MAKDLPDYMRGFDLDDDWGMTPVSQAPSSQPAIDPQAIDNQNVELSKVKSDVSSIKSMMNEIMQIVAEKDTINKEISDEEVKTKFKDIEKLILPFLYNLMKSDEPYIHWPNRAPIIKAQIEKLLKLTRG
jgi:hypothetical protein|tara:strand:+ start:578 stop:967 length:390 start_codon:yes stop_codon:yes gene_type:complete